MPPPTKAFGSKVPPQSRTTAAAAPKTGSRIAPSKAAAAAALGELTTENATLIADSEALRAQCAANGAAQAEAQRSLALALEREGDLAVLLASAGNDAMAVNPIDWTVAEARDALQQDAEHELCLNRCVAFRPLPFIGHSHNIFENTPAW